jgi:hypothetical protein
VLAAMAGMSPPALLWTLVKADDRCVMKPSCTFIVF